MSLNPKFIIAPNPQEYYVDKATGLPLSGGKVEYYSDVNRSTLKPIYMLSGSPPDYTYTQLPNPLTLSAVGTPLYQNNDIRPVYYPYDDEGKLELYYLRVYSADDVFQFDRVAWPLLTDEGGSSAENNVTNFIPNGQFLLHNNIVAQPFNDIEEGEITQAVTEIAPGGWYFVRPESTTSRDFITFYTYPQFVDDPTSSPRFAIQGVCLTPNSSDITKDIRVRFTDVNKFASDVNEYTFGFEGITFNSGDFEVSVQVIKYFGTGGSPSPTEIIDIDEFTITDEQTFFQVPFLFESNEGFSIGTNGDSYVEIALSFPKNISHGYRLTNFCQLGGNVTISSFPATTDKDFSARSMVLPTPNYDGYDIGLPIVPTREGLEVDYSGVASVLASFRDEIERHHFCDGSQFLTEGYQDDGVPNRRLFDKLYNVNFGFPIFGTGSNYALCLNFINSPTPGQLILYNNTNGLVTETEDGIDPTGFTFSRVHVGGDSYDVSSFGLFNYPTIPDDKFIIWNNNFGSVTEADDGDSGFTVKTLRKGYSTITAQITQFTVPAGYTGMGGKYFKFYTPDEYYVWFTVDGVGADPDPGGTGIKVNLSAAVDDTGSRLAQKIAYALNGYEVCSIKTIAGSVIPPGSYFVFETIGGSSNNYYVWYEVSGVGDDPEVSGMKGIKVSILTADNADTVRIKTTAAINSVYFAVPDLRGQFLRGLDKNPPTYDKGIRFSKYSPIGNLIMGSFEFDDNLLHDHFYDGIRSGTGVSEGASTLAANGNTTPFDDSGGAHPGGPQSVPYNASVNFFIKY